jgi:hypothetical protein
MGQDREFIFVARVTYTYNPLPSTSLLVPGTRHALSAVGAHFQPWTMPTERIFLWQFMNSSRLTFQEKMNFTHLI